MLVKTLRSLADVTQTGQLHEIVAMRLARKLEGHWKNMHINDVFTTLRFFHLHGVELSSEAVEELRK